jgi:hypothetical protein
MQSLFSTRYFILVTLLFLSAQAGEAFAQESLPQSTRAPALETPQTQTTTGIVRNFTRAPTGEIDGFELDNGTTVHYSSLLHTKIAATLQKNSSVRVIGLVALGGASGSKPINLIEAQTITNLTTGATLEVDKQLSQQSPTSQNSQTVPVSK